jgi:hypothetical protein
VVLDLDCWISELCYVMKSQLLKSEYPGDRSRLSCLRVLLLTPPTPSVKAGDDDEGDNGKKAADSTGPLSPGGEHVGVDVPPRHRYV